MSAKRFGFERVPTWSVVLGTVLLIGILSMAYGYHKNVHVVLYVGFAITMLGVFNGFILFAMRPNDFRLRKRKE
ncbi:MAG: hypothetical protein ACLP05_11280 [Candidatus Kryptoniota bacterium]